MPELTSLLQDIYGSQKANPALERIRSEIESTLLCDFPYNMRRAVQFMEFVSAVAKKFVSGDKHESLFQRRDDSRRR